METLLAPALILIHYKFSLIYSLKRSLIEVLDLVLSSTCLIITAHDNDGAEGLFLSGREPGTTTEHVDLNLKTISLSEQEQNMHLEYLERMQEETGVKPVWLSKDI